jgi:hypothetical protein
VPKSETFVYFIKITATTWFINKIIPESKALVEITDKSSDDEETLSLEVNNMPFQ